MRIRVSAVCLLLAASAGLAGLAGCSQSDDQSDPGGSASASDRPTPPYAAELAVVDETSSAPGPVLTLTNTGRQPDRYIVQVVPPTEGAVAPQQVELKPGEHAELHVLPAPDGSPAPSSDDARVVVHSTGSDQDVATWDLPDS